MFCCRICKEPKEVTEFYPSTRTKTGYTYACKPCLRLEAQRDRQRDRRKARENDKRKNRQRRRLNPHRYWADSNIRNIRKRAARKVMEFDLDLDFLMSILPSHCPILGIELDYLATSGKMTDSSPSVDRLNNDIGYVKTNIVVMSVRANRLKSDANAEDLRKIADFLEKHQRSVELTSVANT